VAGVRHLTMDGLAPVRARLTLDCRGLPCFREV
jgi:hypothetical protein